MENHVNNPTHLLANHCVNAAAIKLEHRDVTANQIVSGTPQVGSVELGELGECAIGVWEHTAGVSTDTEVDEFFIVLSGHATVSFADGAASMELKAGTVGHLAAGTATTWTVTETLRKIYLAA
jgi:uncharacterized cupin superfamily protein